MPNDQSKIKLMINPIKNENVLYRDRHTNLTEKKLKKRCGAGVGTGIQNAYQNSQSRHETKRHPRTIPSRRATGWLEAALG